MGKAWQQLLSKIKTKKGSDSKSPYAGIKPPMTASAGKKAMPMKAKNGKCVKCGKKNCTC